MVWAGNLRRAAAAGRGCLAQHRSRDRRDSVRANRSWLDFLFSTTCTRAEIPVLHGRFSWTCSPSPASCFASRDWSFCSCCLARGHPRGRWWALGLLSPYCSQSFSSIEVAMRVGLSLTLSGAFAAQAFAADVAVMVGIPRLSVAEYHKPYVAIWLERPDQSFVGNIAVWYDFKLKDNE